MDIRCPSCSKLFRVADEKISGKGIRFKCSKCAEVITVTRSDFEADLLAREAGSAAQAAPAPTSAAVPPQAPPAPEPEAREYTPQEGQPQTVPQAGEQQADDQMPPASLGDFDFSAPHEAATAAAHPADGFGGPDRSFEGGQEQAAPEITISPEAAAEAEAALDFPVDLISEPKRKPAFGAMAPAQPTAPSAEAAPAEGPALGAADEELDLGAALAIPKGPVADAGMTASDQGPASGAAPAAPPTGPVITPELLAQMKRTAAAKSKQQVKAAPMAEADIDLETALAMPRTTPTAGRQGADAGSAADAASHGFEGSSSRKRVLIGILIALALGTAAAALYFQGLIGGNAGQEAQQQPRPARRQALQEITPAGLQIADAYGYVDPATGDLIITGSVRNTQDRPKAGWFLVIEVRDAQEAVLTTVRMLNGAQLYSGREYEVLTKRGVNSEDLKKRAATAVGKGEIPARGSVDFEARVISPPAGSARFLPMLRTPDPESVGAVVQ